MTIIQLCAFAGLAQNVCDVEWMRSTTDCWIFGEFIKDLLAIYWVAISQQFSLSNNCYFIVLVFANARHWCSRWVGCNLDGSDGIVMVYCARLNILWCLKSFERVLEVLEEFWKVSKSSMKFWRVLKSFKEFLSNLEFNKDRKLC